MSRRQTLNRAGSSLVEMLVAIVLLSTLTTALTQTLIAAHRNRSALRRSTTIVRLAEAGLEQIKSIGRVDPLDQGTEFFRDGTLEIWAEDLGLYRAQVRVGSKSSPSIQLELVTLVRR